MEYICAVHHAALSPKHTLLHQIETKTKVPNTSKFKNPGRKEENLNKKKHALLSPELVNILVQYERERLCTAVNDVSFGSVAQEEFFL